jgi:hypothetical protein
MAPLSPLFFQMMFYQFKEELLNQIQVQLCKDQRLWGK